MAARARKTIIYQVSRRRRRRRLPAVLGALLSSPPLTPRALFCYRVFFALAVDGRWDEGGLPNVGDTRHRR